MIPVARIRVLLAMRWADLDLQNDLGALLPPDGVILSGDEVAQVREAIAASRSAMKCGEPLSARVSARQRAALSLLDSAGEED